VGVQFIGNSIYTSVWVAAVCLFMELLGFSTQKWITAGGFGTVLLTLAGREVLLAFSIPSKHMMISACRVKVTNAHGMLIFYMASCQLPSRLDKRITCTLALKTGSLHHQLINLVSGSFQHKSHSLCPGYLTDFHKLSVKCHDPCNKTICGE
jgi:hypothetical protein